MLNEENNNYNYEPNWDASNTGSPRKNKLFIGGIVAAVLVLAAGVTAFAAKDKISNFFLNKSSSPVEYYRTVETNNIDKYIESGMKSYTEKYELLTSKSYSSEGSLKLELGDTVRTLLSVAATSVPGLSDLKSVTISANSSVENSAVSVGLASEINDTNLLSANTYFDLEQKQGYVQIPEISDSYLDFSKGMEQLSGTNGDDSIDTLLTMVQSLFAGNTYPEPEKIKTICETYSKLFVNSVNNVTKETVSIKAMDVEQNCTALTVKMSGTEFYDFMMLFLNTIQNDETLKSILTDYMDSIKNALPGADFEGTDFTTLWTQIDKAKSELKASKLDFDVCKEFFTMIVYVDGDGNIIGRDMTLADAKDTISFTYKKAISGNNLGYEMNVMYNDTSYFEITGSGSASFTNFNADFDIKLPSEDISIHAKIENGDIIKLLEGTFSGDITISTDYPMLSGYQLKLTTDVKEMSTYLKAEVLSGGTSQGALTLSSSTSKEPKLQKPADSDTLIDIMDTQALQTYISGFNIETFVNNFSKKSGIQISIEDIQSLLNSFAGGDDYTNDDDYDFTNNYDDYDYNFDDYGDDDYNDYGDSFDFGDFDL